MRPPVASPFVVGAVVAAQALVLGWMAGEREWIVRTGQVVHLRTAPVDPRDPFRGDFVRLQYEINGVTLDEGESLPPEGARARKRDEVIYTRLVPGGDGVYEAAGATRRRPAEGVFLRGRTDAGGEWLLDTGPHGVAVRYGIEQFFVEQGAGLAIEQRRGTRDGVQVPMEVEVAVGRTGTGVVRGYRWSPLGVKLEVLRRPVPRDRRQPPEGAPVPEGPLSPAVRVTLVNVSEGPVAIADTDRRCAFRLVAAGWSRTSYAPPVDDCAGQPGAPRVVALAPGDTYAVDLDLSDPRWHVLREGRAVEVGALPEMAQFRIEYRAPRDVPAAAQAVWRGRLHTARFTGNGVVD